MNKIVIVIGLIVAGVAAVVILPSVVHRYTFSVGQRVRLISSSDKFMLSAFGVALGTIYTIGKRGYDTLKGGGEYYMLICPGGWVNPTNPSVGGPNYPTTFTPSQLIAV